MRLIWVENKEDHFAGNLEAYQSGNQVMLMSWQEPLEDPINRMAKRIIDVLFSSLVIVTILPGLCLFVWLLHRIFSPGPLFYRQVRTGRDGEVFQMLKFRSMRVNDTPGAQATVGDNRIFTGGNFLRRSSLDEIPQFLNVFKGEMSIVGPRPHFVDHDVEFGEIIENYPLRQFAKPGITGLAQVKGCRGETNTPRKVRQRVRLDHFYLHHWSPMLDLFIVGNTMIQVIWPHRNAR